jgi:transcription elongation factor GreA
MNLGTIGYFGNYSVYDFTGDSERALMNKVPITSEGSSVLANELRHRIQRERPRLIQRIQDAIADDTNLSENAEYQAVLSEQDANEARIADLEDKLARAEVIDLSKLSGDTITFGAKVTLIDEDTHEKKIWQIVGEAESDIRRGKISVNSPLARALIGKTEGATVEVLAPAGAKSFIVTKVEWHNGRQ